MPALHQWDYLFAIGAIFSALDAYNIGANDVANSFATSVSSRSLTMLQACIAAGICEFLGAVLVGARVASTIKNAIIPIEVFQDNAGVQLLAFTVAITVSGSWLMICTRLSWPVSTTYSLVSAVAGVGVAVGGKNAVAWGWNGGKGMGAIFAGLIIAPALSAGFGSVLFLLVKYVVLARKNAVMWSICTAPIIFFLVATICTMSIIYKGSPSLGLDDMAPGPMAAAICGTGAVVTLLAVLFWVPYVYTKVIKKDYTLRWYHFFCGPLLWSRVPPADAQEIASVVPDYSFYREQDKPKTDTEFDAQQQASTEQNSTNDDKLDLEGAKPAQGQIHQSKLNQEVEKDPHAIEGPWILPKNLWIIVRYKLIGVIVHGATYDIHAAQAGAEGTADHARMEKVMARSVQYSNEVEHSYSFVQVMSACTASFAHGANDVSNAIGPFSVIYLVWSTGNSASAKADVPMWILVAGGLLIVLGLSTYGYNIMKVLGNKITRLSPSRGFCMELGAAITVILASQYGLPVSTTMCITGSTIGVGLMNFDLSAINWRSIAWIVAGWLITIPVVGTTAGCLMGMFLNAPHF